MVEEESQEEGRLYECGECKLKYKEKEWAEKCEAWCKEHNSCHLEIIKHAVLEEDSL